MDNRGSKLELNKNDSIKAQRADGSLCFIKKHIRCTLMGFERNYQLNNLSKQLRLNKNLSTLNNQPKLNP
jgi:hypothetical protein